MFKNKNKIFFVTDYRLCEADEFRCDNGQCIPLEYKCKKYREEQMGCVDESHLRNCGMLNVNIYIYCHMYLYYHVCFKVVYPQRPQLIKFGARIYDLLNN